MKLVKYTLIIVIILMIGFYLNEKKSKNQNAIYGFINANYENIYLWNKKLQIGNSLPEIIIYDKNIIFINKNAYSEQVYDSLDWDYNLLQNIKEVNEVNRKKYINSKNNIFSNKDSIYMLSNPLFSTSNNFAVIHQIKVSIGNNNYKTNTTDEYVIWGKKYSKWYKYSIIEKERFIKMIENRYILSSSQILDSIARLRE